NINMIIGGPPCQGFSLKGKKLGLDDPRNFLFVEYLHLVEELNPEVFVIENVKSLMSTSNGWFKNQIIDKIEKLGYKVSVNSLKASDYGVPQNRERVIFLCSKEKKIDLPEPTMKQPTTVRDAIEDLAYLNSNEGDFEQEYITEAKSEYQKTMRIHSNKLYNHKASNHSEIAIHKLSLIPPEKGKEFLPEELLGKQKFNSTWGRLTWDKPSPTIDTRFDAASNGTNNHPYLNRSITPREAARLQSFDDSFIFYGKKVDIRTQIGNAVPPLMAKAIADQIYKCTLERRSVEKEYE
ncbi:MAG TPA: DNA cytosine methyltransferase, partial [Campylobacterales bacterium]|nr:DNA cytosine methyltransferase [Campylobacterales bacterium]